MKSRSFFVVLVLACSFTAFAEEPDRVSLENHDEDRASGAILSLNMPEMIGATDYTKSCSCLCTAQGILLLQCGDEVENLGNFGNIKNCNLHKDKHPKCK